jgi:peptide/nickel transport system substrate-binding protein
MAMMDRTRCRARLARGQFRPTSPASIPIYDNSPVAANVRFNLYEQLIEIGKDGDVLPRLATSWEAGSDLKTWTFTIRHDVKFHNGQKLTAEGRCVDV